MGNPYIHRGGFRMDTQVSPIELAKDCLKRKENFVMQGGAGSGKTETLKELLLYLSNDYPNMAVVCITHTNLAVNEIKSRVGEKYSISTIHSFLNDIIKDYKTNIKTVISDIFTVPQMEREELLEGISEKDYNKMEHEKYKKVHDKYSDILYSLKKERIEKYVGKREYDKDPVIYNQNLNNLIEILNNEIIDTISKSEHSKIRYNDTKFNSFKDLSYGHDGLLDIAYLLFKRYPILCKILCDKYDYIFVDEYQDTRREIVDIFLSLLTGHKSPTLCIFGDTMQSIYKEGIGDAAKYIQDGRLIYIPKKDNYRCSEQVLKFINPLRLDRLEQKVAFKKNHNDVIETLLDRQGEAHILYATYDSKPNAFSDNESKDAYNTAIDKLVGVAQSRMGEHKVLLLTNKAISKKVGFPNLYKIFDDRYVDVGERMDEQLKRIQVEDLCELCYFFMRKQYNNLISTIKSNGFVIRRLSDKQQLSENIKLYFNDNISIFEALELASEFKLIKKTDSYIQYVNRRLLFLDEIKNNNEFQEFKFNYENGFNTFPKMRDMPSDVLEEDFKEFERIWEQESFYNQIFSKEIKFSEAMNYYNYVNEGTQYITMHKTKGSGIDSVLVVMDEYFWNNEYDFSLIYTNDETKQEKRDRSQKLIYVACSRAVTNLTCVKMITPAEEQPFLMFFPNAEKVSID